MVILKKIPYLYLMNQETTLENLTKKDLENLVGYSLEDYCITRTYRGDRCVKIDIKLKPKLEVKEIKVDLVFVKKGSKANL